MNLPESPADLAPDAAVERFAAACEAARSSIAQRKGRATPARVQALAVLQGATHSLSHDEVNAGLLAVGVSMDRVTLYRALDWLVGEGLAHPVASERWGRLYGAAGNEQTHAHFACRVCQRVFCLAAIQPALALALPPGYEFERADLSIQGRCPDCVRAAESELSV